MTQRAIEQIDQLHRIFDLVDTKRPFGELLQMAEYAGATVYWGFWTATELATPVRDL